jgi:TonB family protein
MPALVWSTAAIEDVAADRLQSGMADGRALVAHQSACQVALRERARRRPRIIMAKLGSKTRLFLFCALSLVTLSACHGQEGLDRWYGYRLGTRLDAADIVGAPEARHGSRTVRLKPKGTWVWDEASAMLDPNNVIIALDFEARACQAAPVTAPDPFGREMAKAQAPKCARSEQQIASFADDLRGFIKGRVEPHALPVVEGPRGDQGWRGNPAVTGNDWSFRARFAGCDGGHARYLAPFQDATGTLDRIGLLAMRDRVSLIITIANMAQYDSVRQMISVTDDATERQQQEDQCAGRHVRYVGIRRAGPSSRFGPAQYGTQQADGYTVPPFKWAGVITSQDAPNAAPFDRPETEVEWARLTASLDVDATGSVKSCTIGQSSGVVSLDDLSCRLIMGRFHFYPARDDAGHPVPARLIYALTWPLPRDGHEPAGGIDGVDAFGRMTHPYPHAAAPLNLGSWDASNAYPAGAKARHEQGVVNIELAVGLDGLPRGCTIIASSGWADLDDAACQFLTTHERFRAATDGSGNPIMGHFRQSFKWIDPFAR